ncbi:MAG: redox-sensing transcriptional repressor Rex [Deltaproteobacteria bacterium]|nr:redox-sensing transcriptional repressor Rex [Deltaproteobacteria bacterium]
MRLKHVNLERLVHYYHALGEREAAGEFFSSGQIASLLHMDDTQIRKDLAAIGVRGYPRRGFRTAEVVEAIRETLGFSKNYTAILVGAGHLGGALAAYGAFSKYGMKVVGVFDREPEKQGQRFGRLLVQPMARLRSKVRKHGVRLAMIAVPAAEAQEVADTVVAAGICTLWSFAPTTLVVPKHVYVRNEHISVGLGELAYTLKHCPPE